MSRPSTCGREEIQARAKKAYLEQRLQGAQPLDLLVMLYEGMLQGVMAGESCLARKDWEGAMAALGKARRITTYLCNSLQNEGGEISARLRSLYVYCFENIGRASLEKDASLLPGVKRVIEELMEGWMELADSQAPGIEKPIEEETP